jgi:hypothetical protein
MQRWKNDILWERSPVIKTCEYRMIPWSWCHEESRADQIALKTKIPKKEIEALTSHAVHFT